MAKSNTTTSRPIEFLPKPLFSVGDAAAYLDVSASTVRRRIAAGTLRAQRWGRSWIMWRADLDEYHAGVSSTDRRTPAQSRRVTASSYAPRAPLQRSTPMGAHGTRGVVPSSM